MGPWHASRSPVSAAAARSRPLPSGSLRVKIYARRDPVSQKTHYLTEVVPAGPNAAKEAEKARTQLLARLDEKRAPRTSATVNQLLDRHMELLDVEPTSLASYESLIRVHIKPFSDTCRSAGSTARRSIPSISSYEPAGRTAGVAGTSSTARPQSTSATSVVGRTNVARLALGRSARFTPSSAARADAPCAGIGPGRTRSISRSPSQRRDQTPTRRLRSRRRLSPTRHGSISIGA